MSADTKLLDKKRFIKTYTILYFKARLEYDSKKLLQRLNLNNDKDNNNNDGIAYAMP